MRYSFFKSIRTHLILLVLLSALPALGIIVYSSLETRRHNIADAENDAGRVLAGLAHTHEHTVESTRQFLSTLARLPDVQNLNSVACNRLFGELVKHNPLYANIAVARPDGTVVASGLPFTSTSISNRRFYQNILESNDFSVGGYTRGIIVQRPVFHMAYPVMDKDNTLRGIVVVAINLEHYGQEFARTKLPESSVLAISDHNNRRLYRYPDPQKYVGREDLPHMIRNMSGSSAEGTFLEPGVDGTKRLYAYKRFSLKGSSAEPYLFMRVGISEEKVLAGIRRAFLVNIALLCCACIAALLLAWTLGSFIIARRLDKLLEASRRLGGGDLSARTGLNHSNSELGQLAAAFDTMAETLGEKEAQRAAAETNLKKSEEKFAAAFLKGVVPMAITTVREGRYVDVNEAFASMMGMGRGEIVGSTSTGIGLITPEQRSAFLDNLRQKRFVHNMEMQLKVKGGEPRSGLFSSTAIRLKDEECLVTTLVDITDRKQLEGSLRETRDYLEKLIDHANAPIIVWDAEFTITKFNRAFERLTGRDAREMIGRGLDLLFPEETRQGSLEYIRSTRGKHWETVEIPIQHVDGPAHTLLWNSATLYASDDRTIVATIAQGQDITARKAMEGVIAEREEYLRTILETTRDGFWVVGNEGQITKANPAYSRMTGYSIDELCTLKINDLDALEEPGDTTSRIRRITDNGSEIFETRHRRKDGTVFDVEVSVTYMEKDGGELISFCRDVTSRKQTENQIKFLLSEKELLLKEVHHRIKNNMATVMGLLSLHADALKDSSAVAALEDTRNRIGSMMVLYEKLYRSKDFREVSAREYLTALINEIMDNFPERGLITTGIDIDDMILDATILSPMGIIINELLTNAMKHAFVQGTGGQINISLKSKDGRATLIVQDNGVGLSAPFDITDFMGFGMQLVTILVEQLDGSIRVENENGAKFVLEYPL